MEANVDAKASEYDPKDNFYDFFHVIYFDSTRPK